MSPKRVVYLIATIAILVGLSGCMPMDREAYRDDAAEEVCTEAESCGELGGSYSDCLIDQRARFNDMWPQEECGDDRINEEAYERCMDRARLAACSDNIFDLGSAFSECSADKVCTN